MGQRNDASNVEQALQLTLRDLGQYFGAEPKVHTAYEDTKDKSAGGVTFTAVTHGIAVKGLITCKVGKPTNVAVIYVAANAPPREWSRLTHAAPSAEQPKQGTLRTYAFPDGTGSIGVADGWRSQSPTAMHNVVIEGPGGSAVTMGISLAVLTPQSPFVSLGQSLVAPWAPIPDTFRNLEQQLSLMSQRNGGAARRFDNIKQIETRAAGRPNGLAGTVSLGVTEQNKHYKVLAIVEMWPINETSFMLWVSQARAPDATYERDLPLMLQMMSSLKTNDAAVNQKNRQALADQQARFEAGQAAHKAQVASFDAYNKSYWDLQEARDNRNKAYEADQRARDRRNDDFDEVMRGYRTVEDTRTGEKQQFNLGNVDKIVEGLNEGDPGRYRSIPLRDELHPR